VRGDQGVTGGALAATEAARGRRQAGRPARVELSEAAPPPARPPARARTVVGGA